ncbi:MAG TPA: 6,7-dimethyl-8-ribityllumazine synthase [Candidatus Dormibacteraeota bacterium]|nr:6,7-dimethyl-8-ribityllumazine synthase [Candidatus Dormibacteraeota bacterium]
MTTLSGGTNAQGLQFTVVMARFNDLVGHRLLAGALQTLRRHGVAEDAVTVIEVPGSFELPLVVEEVAAQGGVDAVIALGAVIRGSTPHFDFVAGEAARGLAAAAVRHRVPVAFGVLTTDTLEQALERAGGKMGNKGQDAAETAIEMATLLRRLRDGSPAASRSGEPGA